MQGVIGVSNYDLILFNLLIAKTKLLNAVDVKYILSGGSQSTQPRLKCNTSNNPVRSNTATVDLLLKFRRRTPRMAPNNLKQMRT